MHGERNFTHVWQLHAATWRWQVWRPLNEYPDLVSSRIHAGSQYRVTGIVVDSELFVISCTYNDTFQAQSLDLGSRRWAVRGPAKAYSFPCRVDPLLIALVGRHIWLYQVPNVRRFRLPHPLSSLALMETRAAYVLHARLLSSEPRRRRFHRVRHDPREHGRPLVRAAAVTARRLCGASGGHPARHRIQTGVCLLVRCLACSHAEPLLCWLPAALLLLIRPAFILVLTVPLVPPLSAVCLP